MPDTHTVLHLANVLTIAEADGAFTPAESAALREIMARIGAHDSDLAAARDLRALKPPYRLRSIQHATGTMRMIEDMIFMSLADGQVSPHESRPLEAFLTQQGFVQADIDMVVQRVTPRLRSLPADPSPPPLPRREDVIAASDTVARNMTPPHQQARPPQPIPKPTARPSPPPHGTPAMPTPAPAKIARAADPVSTPGAQMRTAEPEPSLPAKPAADAPPSEPDTDSPLARCMRKRADAPRGACYCFGAPDAPLNPWGCRLTHMAWTPDADWLRLGHFRDSDTFIFDHEAIAARLCQRLTTVSECPFLLAGFAEQALAALPSRATTMGRWQHHFVSHTVPAGQAVTVRSYRHGCCREVAALADGLSPTDDRDARRLIGRTVRRTGADIDLNRMVNSTGG